MTHPRWLDKLADFKKDVDAVYSATIDTCAKLQLKSLDENSEALLVCIIQSPDGLQIDASLSVH